MTIRLLHLSDFHFGAGRGTHDDRLLRALEASISGRTFDRIIVSGDVTERGDPASLERAKMWLLDEIQLSDGSVSGLRLGDFSRLRIIPGNHDAFDAETSYKLRFWQQSVEAFYAEFDADRELSRKKLSWEWLERSGEAAFIVYLDSCYLGGAGTTTRFPGFLARTARGKLSVEQTEALLRLHDKGARGELADSNENPISATAFRRSMKLVVMHHFIVPPKMKTRLRTKLNMWTCMKLDQRRRAFANLLLADVSMLLCGHSHLGELQQIVIGEHLDRRASARYMLNKVRRQLGLPSEPLRSGGRYVGKTLSPFLRLLYQADSSKDLAGFNELLDQLLRGNTDLKQQLQDHLLQDEDLGREISAEEIRLLTMAVQALGKKQRKELRKIATDIFSEAAELRQNRFLQAMNGSSVKKWSIGKRRTYFEYELDRNAAGKWAVLVTRYEYQDPIGFVPAPSELFSPTA